MKEIDMHDLANMIREKMRCEQGVVTNETNEHKKKEYEDKIEKKPNCFAIINFESNVDVDFVMTMKEISIPVLGEPTGILLFGTGKNVVMSSLPEGHYYFCNFGRLHYIVSINQATKEFTIRKDVISYIGTFNIKFESDEVKFEQILTKNSFEEGKKLLIEKYPEIDQEIVNQF